MNRHNIGFALFLILLLLAPELPLHHLDLLPFERLNVSMGALGLLIWFLLSSPQLGLKSVYSVRDVLLLVIFSYFVLFTSLVSLNTTAFLYASQYFYYTFLGGALIPAYLHYRASQNRLGEVYTIVAWVGAIFAVGLLVSLWTGPFYPHQVGYAWRYHEDATVLRAIGFATSANGAGGLAAVLAAFFLFVHGRRSRFGYPLAILCLAAMVATLSRSAVVSFAVALVALGLLQTLRLLLMRGVRRPSLPRILPYLALVLVAATAVLALDADTRRAAVDGAYYGLGLDSFAEQDVDARLDLWQWGLDRWTEKPAWQQMIGSGFLTTTRLTADGAYITAHNAYLQMLNDFGLLGLVLFAVFLATAIARAAFSVFVAGSNGANAFCFVSLIQIAVHNLTEIFLFHPANVTMLVFIVALAAVHARKREPVPFGRTLTGVVPGRATGVAR